jgi:hypothetical protein
MKAYTTEKDITLKAFVYGDPGVGKTTFFASAMDDPRTSPVLWLDCGGNPQSIRNRKPQPHIFMIEGSKDLDLPYDWLLKGQPAEHKFIDEATKMGVTLSRPTTVPLGEKYKTVVFDGLTDYQRICMDELTGNDKRKFGETLAFADQRTWGQALSKLTKLARLLFGIPNISVLVSALERQEIDGLTQAVSYGPGLWGQARAEVPGYSLLTMRMVRRSKMSTKEQKLVAEQETDGVSNEPAYSTGYIDQVGKFLAKEQYGGKLPARMASPTIPTIMTAIYGSLALLPI